MIRAFISVLVSFVLAIRSSGYTKHASDKDLAELRQMKGIEIATREEQRPGEKNLVNFEIGWLPENDIVGKTLIEKFRVQIQAKDEEATRQAQWEKSTGRYLLHVELFGVDRTGRTVCVTRLPVQQLSRRDVLRSPFNGETHNLIQFSLDNQLIEHSFLRFWEYIGVGATRFTDVYLGIKPALRPKKSEAFTEPSEQ